MTVRELITEQVKKLREFARLCNDPLINDTQTKICGKLMSDAADTIEMLSAKCRDRWIPTSERLPDKDGVYIATERVYSLNDKDHKGLSYTKVEPTEFRDGKWRRASFYEVTAWQSLPRPYEEDIEWLKQTSKATEITYWQTCGTNTPSVQNCAYKLWRIVSYRKTLKRGYSTVS